LVLVNQNTTEYFDVFKDFEKKLGRKIQHFQVVFEDFFLISFSRIFTNLINQISWSEYKIKACINSTKCIKQNSQKEYQTAMK
jgi:hypothetical protein